MRHDGTDDMGWNGREWMKGKTHATLLFIGDAERHLEDHPNEPQRARLERFIQQLGQGRHSLHEFLTVELFLQGLTHQQYLETLELLPSLPPRDPRQPELLRRIYHYQANSRRYVIVCKTACYVGQGMSFEPGEVLDSFYARDEAEAKLQRVNSDPWCADCWELRELEPTYAPNAWEGEDGNPP